VPVRVLLPVLLLLAAVAVVAVNVVQVRRGRLLYAPGGLARDVRDVRRRSTAAVVEASGLAVLALGLLTRDKPIVWVGALVLAVGALLMSFARRGLARRSRRTRQRRT
jgi:hypothetical protein